MFKFFLVCLFAIFACAMATPAVVAAPYAYSAYSAYSPYTAYSAPVAATYGAYPYTAGYSAYPYAAAAYFIVCLFAIFACAMASPAVVASPYAYSAYSAYSPYTAYSAPVAATYGAYPYTAAQWYRKNWSKKREIIRPFQDKVNFLLKYIETAHKNKVDKTDICKIENFIKSVDIKLKSVRYSIAKFRSKFSDWLDECVEVAICVSTVGAPCKQYEDLSSKSKRKRLSTSLETLSNEEVSDTFKAMLEKKNSLWMP
ncbi:hypothetical protein CVS40_8521 [Lucilia cuprina]|nr:hypothetical protein CVS40_8521 [Lucilia cuprina]